MYMALKGQTLNKHQHIVYDGQYDLNTYMYT